MLTVGTIGLAVVLKRQSEPKASIPDARIFEAPQKWSDYDREATEQEMQKHPGVGVKPINRDSSSSLLLRADPSSPNALLLKASNREVALRFDPSDKKLRPVDDQLWERAATQTMDCSKPYPLLQGVGRGHDVRIYNQQSELIVAGRKVSTVGGIPMIFQISPSGRWIAVSSAAGPWGKESNFPFAGNPLYGDRYHQTISLPDGKTVGNVFRIPKAGKYDWPFPCWSPDERYVVYYDPESLDLIIAETDLLYIP
jgi:hypothetical protein